jgi:hypothetical protein
LIIDGHGLHVTIQELEQVPKVGLNMVTSFAHTSYVLQPLDVTYFKTFKIVFRKKKDFTMVKNNYLELDKATLATSVENALQQSLKKENIKLGFRVSII